MNQSLKTDRFRVEVSEQMVVEHGFNEGCFNAVRRAAMFVDTIGIVVSSHQKSQWTLDLPNFHNELVEFQLESVPVHFLAVERSAAGNLAVRDPALEFQPTEDEFRTALAVVAGLELRIDVRNDSPRDLVVTTENFVVFDTVKDEAADVAIASALFPKYDFKGRVDPHLGFYLDLFTLPAAAPGRPKSVATMQMGLAPVVASGRRLLMTHLAYLPLPNRAVLAEETGRRDAEIAALEAQMDGVPTDGVLEDDIARAKRRRTDYLIAEWQLDKRVHLRGFCIFGKLVPVFSARFMLRLALRKLRAWLVVLVREDLDSLQIEQLVNGREFQLEMRVSSATAAEVVTRRLFDHYFGDAQPQNNNLRLTFCADRKDHPSDTSTVLRMTYVATGSKKVDKGAAHATCAKNLRDAVGLQESGEDAGTEKSLWSSLERFEAAL